MFGQLNVSVFVFSDASHSRGKLVRLASYHCRREECERKMSEFAEANPMIWSSMQSEIRAEWVARDIVI